MESSRVIVAELLVGTDPLADSACIGLLSYREEDELVDFKESFERSDRSWIELAIDCAAFANTGGGYLVFGVADKTWALTGLDGDAVAALTDIKKCLEKVNRNLVPVLTRLRSRHVEHDGKSFVIVHVPCSLDSTHVFESNLDWTPPSGKTQTRVQKGAIYVRRSGSNQVMTSADFEALVERRLQRFRSKVLEGLTRVVTAPTSHDVVTVIRGQDALGETTVTISDAPASLDLRGKPLKLLSNSILDKIGLYRSVTQADERFDVPRGFLYETYASRGELEVDSEGARWLAHHSLRQGAPCFWWLREMKRSDAQETIKRAFNASPAWRKEYILRYSGFYGEKFFNLLRDRLQELGRPSAIQFRGAKDLLNVDRSKHPAEDAARATELASALVKSGDAMLEHALEKLDCSLYAPY